MALFLPAWSVQQALYAASFATALVVVGTHGSIVSRPLLGTHHAGLWTTVYLGQFGLLAAAALVMPLNGLLAHWLGASLPLTMLVAPPAIILRLVQLRRRPPPAPLLAPLLLLGLASLALVFSIYSRDISALGLDLHEHIAWVQQIVSGGFVPLAEPGTRIVGDYPRTFHVVTALWDAAGLGLPAGPFTKSMPFLQNALPLLSIAEQLVDAAPAEAEALRRKRQVALALAFFLYAFLLVPMVYPWTDLSGAPRYSGGGVLLLPIVLMLIGRIRNAPQASALALTSAPLVAAWALAWSPIVLILLAVVTGPVLAAFWIFFRPPLSGVARSVRASALVACAALALLSVAQDPWIVGIAARNVGMLRELTHRAGLVTFDEAAASGLLARGEYSAPVR